MPIHQLPANCPTADGKLFDVLHDMFGIGTFDELAEELPWWRFRQRETAKIKASRKKHKKSLPDLFVAALYCRAHSIDVQNVTFLMRHVKDAWEWWGSTHRAGDSAPFNERFAEAVREEMANLDDTWLNRLLRAAPFAREEVYQQWTERT